MAVQTVAAPPGVARFIVAPPAPRPGPPAGGNRDRRSRLEWWQPGWPLTYLLTGYPLWWLLGTTQIFLVLAVVIMAVQLVRTHRVFARPGFGWWLLFLAWVAVGVLLLQVNAPGAEPGASNSRYVTFTYRFCLYLAATIVLLYVYNLRSRIPTVRILRAFGWLFVTVVGGGVLGATVPYLNFPSAMELILPHGIAHIDFVHSLIHPGVAQVIDPEHPTGDPRTSAPFTYTNEWGLSFACLLPFFVAAWFGREAAWRRHAAPWILLIAVYPVVQSRNRGLWIALVVTGLVVLVRTMVFGKIKIAIGAVAGAALAVAVVLSTPLGTTITDRLTTQGSEGGRTTLGTDTLNSVAEKSPVVGLGTTRPVQGSFYSIVGGDSAFCTGCSPPPFGTQGQFWLVAFTTGYGGLLFYLGFILIQLFRHIRLRSPVGTVGIVVIVVHLSTMLVYSSLGLELVIIFAAIGLLWREKAGVPDNRTGQVQPDPRLGGYAGLLRRNVAFVLVCAVLGIGGGLAYQDIRGISHEAFTSVVIPVDPTSPIAGGTGLTMDTIAQLIGTPAVGRAVKQVTGTALYPGGSHLYVTAKTSSRVLEIHVAANRAHVAAPASRAAGAALIDSRARVLAEQRRDDLRELQRQRTAYLAAVATIDTFHERDPSAKPLTGQRQRLVDAAVSVDAKILQRESTRIDPGRVLGTTPAPEETDAWLVAGTSGLILGLLAAVLLLFARHSRGRRSRRTHEYGDLPVLARMAYPGPDTPTSARAARQAAEALGAIGPATVLSADDSQRGRSAAAALDDAIEQRANGANRPHPRRAPVVILAGPDTPDRAFDHVRGGIDACAAAIAGVVVLSDTPVSRSGRRRDRIPLHPTRRLRGKRP